MLAEGLFIQSSPRVSSHYPMFTLRDSTHCVTWKATIRWWCADFFNLGSGFCCWIHPITCWSGVDGPSPCSSSDSNSNLCHCLQIVSLSVILLLVNGTSSTQIFRWHLGLLSWSTFSSSLPCSYCPSLASSQTTSSWVLSCSRARFSVFFSFLVLFHYAVVRLWPSAPSV